MMTSLFRPRPLFAALSLALSGPAFASAALPALPELVLPRRSGSITVDGDLGEEAWTRAASVEHFFEIAPGDNVDPPVKTVGLLAYDAEFLYVGVRCQDPEPSRIRAPYVERDRVTDQDLVQIDLDARDEGRWSMIFRINPRGVQADGVFDEATGVDDFSPDFHFESAARITAEGWTAELKIPLSTLRYRGGDPQTWRITFFRLYPRDFRRQFVSGPIPRGSNCWLCHALRLTDIIGLPRGGGVTFSPFVTGGATKGADAAATTERRVDVGGDVKWLPQLNLAVDLTLRPDFSQVEADVPQIGVNTRFALFYPEKRPFFMEGLDLWNSPIPVVYTRTITEPDWGARLTGRPGNSSWTLLAAGDQGGGTLILPGPSSSRPVPQPEDSLVFLGRLRHNFGRSSLGTLATVREGGEGYFNRVGGLDFQWYPTASDHAVGQILWSSTRDQGQPSAAGHALSLAWDRSMRHLGLSLKLDDLAHDFRADSGFVPQTGVRHVRASTGYTLYPQGLLRSVRPELGFDEVRERGGGLISQDLNVGVAVDGRVQASMAWHPREQARAGDGRLFEQNYWTASARILPNRRLPYLKVTARYGDEIDIDHSRLGTGSALGLLATVSPSDRLQAELTGERRRLDVDSGADRIRLFTADVARAKLTYTFTARSFMRLVGEWEGLDESGSGGERDQSFSASVLYGYRLNWQSILYLGYDNTPASPGSTGAGRQQELFLKLGYAFR